MHKKIILNGLLLLISLAWLTSCELFTGPNFSNTPSIKFKEIQKYEGITDRLGNKSDSVVIVIEFKDGDGDLGITPDERDTDPRFKLEKPDGTLNRYHYNYFVKVFRKTKGFFQEVQFNPTFSGAFPPLNANGKPGPIEGDLEYGVKFPLLSTQANDTLKFEIQIADRALNESNKVETSEVVVNRK